MRAGGSERVTVGATCDDGKGLNRADRDNFPNSPKTPGKRYKFKLVNFREFVGATLTTSRYYRNIYTHVLVRARAFYNDDGNPSRARIQNDPIV